MKGPISLWQLNAIKILHGIRPLRVLPELDNITWAYRSSSFLREAYFLDFDILGD